jgi:hypothetical protein
LRNSKKQNEKVWVPTIRDKRRCGVRKKMNMEEGTYGLIKFSIDNTVLKYGPNILRDLLDLSSLCYWAGKHNFNLDEITGYIMDKMEDRER